MEEQNSLLRSAYQIACRKGKETNWSAFKNNLEKELLRQTLLTSSGGIKDLSDEQIKLRATCTAKTYRITT
jgi:hypothetical protein